METGAGALVDLVCVGLGDALEAGVSESIRAVVKCRECGLTQYKPKDGKCRRCHKNVAIDPAELAPDLVMNEVESVVAEPSQLPPAGFSSERLRQARKKRKLTQADLARRMGCPRTYINKLEMGRVPKGPEMRQIERLCAALVCKFHDLVYDPAAERRAQEMEILGDPFLAEIAGILSQLTAEHKQSVLAESQWLAHRNRQG